MEEPLLEVVVLQEHQDKVLMLAHQIQFHMHMEQQVLVRQEELEQQHQTVAVQQVAQVYFHLLQVHLSNEQVVAEAEIVQANTAEAHLYQEAQAAQAVVVRDQILTNLQELQEMLTREAEVEMKDIIINLQETLTLLVQVQELVDRDLW
jgi:hypothetical protein